MPAKQRRRIHAGEQRCLSRGALRSARNAQAGVDAAHKQMRALQVYSICQWGVQEMIQERGRKEPEWITLSSVAESYPIHEKKDD